MATEFPTFVDVPEGETPEPGTPLVNAAYLNALTGAVNIVENQLPAKANSASLATVATTGAYTDLVGAPFIPAEPGDIGAQPAGAYATTTDLADKADAEHTHTVGDLDATGTASATTYLRGDGSWAIPAGGSSYTDEQVRDVIGTALVPGANVTITPNDAGDTITIAATGGGGGGAVDSVNGQTGVVALDAADVGATAVSVDSVLVAALDIDSAAVTAADVGAAGLDGDGRVSAAQMPRVPTTVRTVSYASSITLTPATDGNRINVTATGNISSLAASTTGAVDGQVLRVAVLASGAARTVTIASSVRTSTALTRGPHSVPSGEVWTAAFEYYSLASAWVLTAYTTSAS